MRRIAQSIMGWKTQILERICPWKKTGGGDLGQWERKHIFLDTQSTMTVVVGRGAGSGNENTGEPQNNTLFVYVCS